MATVLVVDDEPQMLVALERALSHLDHDVLTARTGREGLDVAVTGRPDVALVDLRLPDVNGVEFVRRVRTWSEMPIIMLSGETSVNAKVAALDAGADDYVGKPFALAELSARIDAALRRSENGPHRGPVLQYGDVTMDLMARNLTVAGSAVQLSPIQWRLLELLAGNPGMILTHGQIITAVWGEAYGDEMRTSLRVHLGHLRARLGDDSAEPRYIATEPRAGYRWIAEPS